MKFLHTSKTKNYTRASIKHEAAMASFNRNNKHISTVISRQQLINHTISVELLNLTLTTEFLHGTFLYCLEQELFFFYVKTF